MSPNALAPRNGGRIESTFQSRAAPPLSWGACLAAFIRFFKSLQSLRFKERARQAGLSDNPQERTRSQFVMIRYGDGDRCVPLFLLHDDVAALLSDLLKALL